MELPHKSAFILGHEEFGCSFVPDDYPQMQTLTIPQFGSVQSLNVSIAASVVMYEYVRQRLRNE
jgi:tRNA G18 (ribose-2'-O)-methylase SpoU